MTPKKTTIFISSLIRNSSESTKDNTISNDNTRTGLQSNNGTANNPQFQNNNQMGEVKIVAPGFGDKNIIQNPMGPQNTQQPQNNMFNQFGFSNFKPETQIRQIKTDDLLMDFGNVKQQQNQIPHQPNQTTASQKNQPQNTIDEDFLSF